MEVLDERELTTPRLILNLVNIPNKQGRLPVLGVICPQLRCHSEC